MKVKVLKQFRDKNTGIIHKQNEIIEVSEKRFNEIVKVGPFIQNIEEPVEVEETTVEETTEEKPKKAAKKKK